MVAINSTPWTIASLCIHSSNLSPNEISDSVGLEPTRVYAKGERYSNRNPESKVREENLWLLESALDEREAIADHINHFISILIKVSDRLNHLDDSCKIEVVCGYSSENGQGGFTLSHELLAELSKLHIELSVNLYPPTCD